MDYKAATIVAFNNLDEKVLSIITYSVIFCNCRPQIYNLVIHVLIACCGILATGYKGSSLWPLCHY